MVYVKKRKPIPDGADFVRSRNNVEEKKLSRELEAIEKTKKLHISRLNAQQQNISSLTYGNSDDDADGNRGSSFQMFKTHYPGFCYHRDGRPRIKGDALLYVFKGTRVTSYHVLRALLFTDNVLDVEKLLTMQAVAVQTLHPELLVLKVRKPSFKQKEGEGSDVSSDSADEEYKDTRPKNIFELLQRAGFPSREDLESNSETIITTLDYLFAMLQEAPKETLAHILSMCSKKKRLIQQQAMQFASHTLPIVPERRLTLTLRRDSKDVYTPRAELLWTPAPAPKERDSKDKHLLGTVSFMPEIKASIEMRPVVDNVLHQIEKEADKLSKGKENKLKKGVKLLTFLLGLNKPAKVNVNPDNEEHIIYQAKELEPDKSKLNVQVTSLALPKRPNQDETRKIKNKKPKKKKVLTSSPFPGKPKKESLPFIVRQQILIDEAKHHPVDPDVESDESSEEEDSPTTSISGPSDEKPISQSLVEKGTKQVRQSETQQISSSEGTRKSTILKSTIDRPKPWAVRSRKSTVVKKRLLPKKSDKDAEDTPQPQSKDSFQMSALRNVKLTAVDLLKIRQEVIAQELSKKMSDLLAHSSQ